MPQFSTITSYSSLAWILARGGGHTRLVEICCTGYGKAVSRLRYSGETTPCTVT